jgi:hypothetical protein
MPLTTPHERVTQAALAGARRAGAAVRHAYPDAEILYDPTPIDAHESAIVAISRCGHGWRIWCVRDGTPGPKAFIRSKQQLSEIRGGLLTYRPLPD